MIIEELVTVFGFENRGKANLDQFNRQVDTGRRKLGLFQSTLAGFAGGIAAVAVAGLTRAFSGLFRTIPQVTGELDKMVKSADRIGISVEALQELGHAAELSGSSVAVLSGTLEMMSSRLAEASRGKGRAAEAFEAYGLSAVDATGKVKQADAMLLDLADAMERLSESEQLDLARKLGIDKGTLTLLRSGRDGIAAMREEARALGLVFGEDAARASEEFNDNLSRMSALMDALKKGIVISMLPNLNKWVEGMVKWFKVNRDIVRQNMERVLTGIGRGLGAIGNAADLAIKAVARMKESFDSFAGDGSTAAVGAGALMLLAAKRFPWVAALAGVILVLDDFAKYLSGEGKSVIGEAMADIEESIGDSTLSSIGDSIEKITGQFDGLFDLFGDNGETSNPLRNLRLWVQEFINLKNAAKGLDRLLNGIGSVLGFLGNIGSGGFGGGGNSGGSDEGPRLQPGDTLRGGRSRTGGGASLNQGSLPSGQQDRANRMMNRLIAKGWTPEAAASVVGQAAHESSFNPTALGDNGSAFGLFQWRLDRRRALERFAKDRGKPASDFDTQVDFFDHERKQRSQAERDWHKVTDVDLGNRIGKQFERYAGGLQHGRATSGRKALAEWQRRGGASQIETNQSAGPTFERFGRGAGGLAAVSSTVSEGSRVGGNVTVNAPVTVSNVKGDVVPKKVGEAISGAVDRGRSAQRASDIAVQRPVPDGPTIRDRSQQAAT